MMWSGAAFLFLMIFVIIGCAELVNRERRHA